VRRSGCPVGCPLALSASVPFSCKPGVRQRFVPATTSSLSKADHGYPGRGGGR
jgi:hypothetical protein